MEENKRIDIAQYSNISWLSAGLGTANFMLTYLFQLYMMLYKELFLLYQGSELIIKMLPIFPTIVCAISIHYCNEYPDLFLIPKKIRTQGKGAMFVRGVICGLIGLPLLCIFFSLLVVFGSDYTF